MVTSRVSARLLCFVLLYGCGSSPSGNGIVTVPTVFIEAGDPLLTQSQGLCRFGQSLFSGWVYTLYNSGDTATVTAYYQGREWGPAHAWYPNRQQKELRYYENGRKTGEHKGWWDDGRPKFIYRFQNDAYEGELQEWYPNGQLYRHMHYHAGQEEGMQQIWQPNGKLHANYVAKDGRNYGLTGTMHCKNTITHE